MHEAHALANIHAASTLHRWIMPRFFAADIDELVQLASYAVPPVAPGDRAEVIHRDRKILLEVRTVDPLVEWVERIDHADPPEHP